MLKYSGIERESVVDGIGLRLTIFFSGCKHHCHGCHNPKTWDFNYGNEFDERVQDKIIEIVKQPIYDGITLSGGDPMFSAEKVLEFVKKFKKETNNERDIWLYTGYEVESLLDHGDKYQKELIDMVDYIVDGKFHEEEKNLLLAFRGSSNQRIFRNSMGVLTDITKQIDIKK